MVSRKGLCGKKSSLCPDQHVDTYDGLKGIHKVHLGGIHPDVLRRHEGE